MIKSILFVALLCASISAQRVIELNFEHSLRIPYHNVKSNYSRPSGNKIC